MKAILLFQLLLAAIIAAHNLTFDYVIVGAGTAGLVIANRLSEDPNIRVGVIEPGDDVRNDPSVTSTGDVGNQFNPALDWAYNTTAQPQIGGRIIPYHAGKAIGGTSNINGKFEPNLSSLSMAFSSTLR